MDSEGDPDFNLYKLWSNHRRVVTFGGVLILFGAYINPIIQTHKRKSICADIESYRAIRSKENGSQYFYRMSKKLGLNIDRKGFTPRDIGVFCAYYKEGSYG